MTKNFNILAINLSVLHNYFDSPKLFSDLYLAKIFDISAQFFFSDIFYDIDFPFIYDIDCYNLLLYF